MSQINPFLESGYFFLEFRLGNEVEESFPSLDAPVTQRGEGEDWKLTNVPPGQNIPLTKPLENLLNQAHKIILQAEKGHITEDMIDHFRQMSHSIEGLSFDEFGALWDEVVRLLNHALPIFGNLDPQGKRLFTRFIAEYFRLIPTHPDQDSEECCRYVAVRLEPSALDTLLEHADCSIRICDLKIITGFVYFTYKKHSPLSHVFSPLERQFAVRCFKRCLTSDSFSFSALDQLIYKKDLQFLWPLLKQELDEGHLSREQMFQILLDGCLFLNRSFSQFYSMHPNPSPLSQQGIQVLTDIATRLPECRMLFLGSLGPQLTSDEFTLLAHILLPKDLPQGTINSRLNHWLLRELPEIPTSDVVAESHHYYQFHTLLVELGRRGILQIETQDIARLLHNYFRNPLMLPTRDYFKGIKSEKVCESTVYLLKLLLTQAPQAFIIAFRAWATWALHADFRMFLFYLSNFIKDTGLPAGLEIPLDRFFGEVVAENINGGTISNLRLLCGLGFLAQKGYLERLRGPNNHYLPNNRRRVSNLVSFIVDKENPQSLSFQDYLNVHNSLEALHKSGFIKELPSKWTDFNASFQHHVRRERQLHGGKLPLFVKKNEPSPLVL